MAALVAGLAAADAVAAQESGCWDRTYTDAHLASHPDQSVRRITARIQPADDETFTHFLAVRVVFAPQGIGGENVVPGRAYVQGLICFPGPDPGATGYPDWVRPGRTICAVECDGGTLQISDQQEDRLDLRTAGFALEEADEGCGGPAWLAPEGRASVLFRLVPASPETCQFE